METDEGGRVYVGGDQGVPRVVRSMGVSVVLLLVLHSDEIA